MSRYMPFGLLSFVILFTNRNMCLMSALNMYKNLIGKPKPLTASVIYIYIYIYLFD
jgi:hypothetical protein